MQIAAALKWMYIMFVFTSSSDWCLRLQYPYFPVWCSHRDHPTVLHLPSSGVMCKIFSWELVLLLMFSSFQYNHSTVSVTQLCILSLRVTDSLHGNILMHFWVVSPPNAITKETLQVLRNCRLSFFNVCSLCLMCTLSLSVSLGTYCSV